MGLDNDTRGWVMACISGVACIIGSCVICVDLLVRLVPRWRTFRIEDSNRFLAGSLSLSAGVMLYSALYSMLPSSKSSLVKGGMAPSPAAFTMIGCFLGGVIGIQVLSKLMHRLLPSHVVDCDHTHKDEEYQEDDHSHHEAGSNGFVEERPLLSRELSYDERPIRPQFKKAQTEVRQDDTLLKGEFNQKASIGRKIAQTMSSFISNSDNVCDTNGPCFGYSNPCGNECYRVITQNGNKASFVPINTMNGRSSSKTAVRYQPKRYASTPAGISGSQVPINVNGYGAVGRRDSSVSSETSHDASSHDSHGQEMQGSLHHHHVASNEFLSIGLQTSIAIALHKLPEGFITYATNHANPKLGVSIFMALFIHNITEGFALAVPLYLALHSRLKACLWSTLLGGASQPLGAGIAALWFHVAQKRDMAPSEGVYGVMFALTAGIMTNVALQLFSESLSLIHNKALCISMAFVGMGILGFSNALTAS